MSAYLTCPNCQSENLTVVERGLQNDTLFKVACDNCAHTWIQPYRIPEPPTAPTNEGVCYDCGKNFTFDSLDGKCPHCGSGKWSGVGSFCVS